MQRDGNRPERTVFAITDVGRLKLIDWLSELICVPAHDYTQFEAALCLPPCEAARLRERCERIEMELAQGLAMREFAIKRDPPRIFWVESELRWHLRNVELEFVRTLVADIESGSLDSMDRWRGFRGEAQVLSIKDGPRRRSD